MQLPHSAGTLTQASSCQCHAFTRPVFESPVGVMSAGVIRDHASGPGHARVPTLAGRRAPLTTSSTSKTPPGQESNMPPISRWQFQQQPPDMSLSSYVWDVSNPNYPDLELVPASGTAARCCPHPKVVVSCAAPCVTFPVQPLFAWSTISRTRISSSAAATMAFCSESNTTVFSCTATRRGANFE